MILFNKEEEAKEFDFQYPSKDIESINIIPGKNTTLICTRFSKILNETIFGQGQKTLIPDEMLRLSSIVHLLTVTSATNHALEGLYPE